MDNGFDGTAAQTDHLLHLAQRRFDRRCHGRTAQSRIDLGRLAVENIEGPVRPDWQGDVQIFQHRKDGHGPNIDTIDASGNSPFQFILDSCPVFFADDARRSRPQGSPLFMRCLDSGLPSLGAKGMVMIRFAAEENDIGAMSYSRGDAVDAVTADDELHGLNRSIRQSRRLPIRSRTGFGPRIISQDTID